MNNPESIQSEHYNFYDYLHEARLVSKKTLKHIAHVLGKKPSYLSELERGLRPVPNDDTFILRLEKLLGTPKGELLCLARLSREDIGDRLLKLLKDDVCFAMDYYRTIYSTDDKELLCALKNFIETLKNGQHP
jgi:transcriptional regulator with XRE-family HTH domain